MINTSQDILFIVIAVVVAAVGLFFCLGAYYIIKILRKAHKTVALIQEKIEMMGEMLETIKEKISNSATQINLITQAITKLIEFFRSRKEKQEQGKKSK